MNTAPQRHPGAGLLAGKNAIITGTAMGLGKAMARVFVREGARVLAVDFDPGNAASLADIGEDCVPFHADISKEADVIAMFAQAKALFGRVDIVVNNAGTVASADRAELTLSDYEVFTQTNLLGAVLVSRLAVETMIPQGGGTIIHVTSVGSLNAEERAPIVYSAAKAAVNSMTKALAIKYGGQGIRANVLAPGFSTTEKIAAATPEVLAQMAAKNPFNRPADAEEQAQVAVFLASDRSSYVNGVVLPVDGGWSARMA